MPVKMIRGAFFRKRNGKHGKRKKRTNIGHQEKMFKIATGHKGTMCLQDVSFDVNKEKKIKQKHHLLKTSKSSCRKIHFLAIALQFFFFCLLALCGLVMMSFYRLSRSFSICISFAPTWPFHFQNSFAAEFSSSI